MITQTTPYNRQGTLVFCCQKSRRNSRGHPNWGAEARWVGSDRQLSTNVSLQLRKKRCA